MVFFFHPVVSFILPLAVACLLCPELRPVFPGLAWITGRTKWARTVQAFLVISFAPIMGMNSEGPVNLVLNTTFVIGCLLLCLRLGRPAFRNPDGLPIVVFSRWGFTGLCVYRGLLYGTTYFLLRPEGLPSVPVQLLTLSFYAVTVLGLWLHGQAPPVPAANQVSVDAEELKRVRRWLALLLLLALARHSDIRLTLQTYTRVELHDSTLAIRALPGPGREVSGGSTNKLARTRAKQCRMS